jgi:hypothetical protein
MPESIAPFKPGMVTPPARTLFVRYAAPQPGLTVIEANDDIGKRE